MLSPQFCSLDRQGVRCRLATAAEAGTAVEIPAAIISRMSLEDMLLNKLVVIKVLSMIDEDTCRVTLPVCEQNQQQVPQLARSRPLFSLSLCYPPVWVWGVCVSQNRPTPFPVWMS